MADDRGDVHGVLDDAERLLRRWDTPLQAALVAVVDRQVTDTVATMAVDLRHDGVARLKVNPDFVVDIGAEGTAFVLCHEALHLLLDHLHHRGARDDAWRLACEVVINHWVIRSTGRSLPRSKRTGLPVGVDPRQVHHDWAQTATRTVSYPKFVITDERCAQLLRTHPPTDLLPDVCEHTTQPASDTGTSDSDPVEQVLEAAVGRAHRGDEILRAQLLDLEQAVPDTPVWDRLGVSELRATSHRTGSTRLWASQLTHIIGQTLIPDVEVRYDRKVGWWDAALLAPLGIDLDENVGMPLQQTATTSRQRQVAIYLDTSASVPDTIVDIAAASVGRIADTVAHWRAFDDRIHPFTPGDALPGGGGTSFRAVADDVDILDAELDDPLDAVLVLTDGHAVPISPPRPHRWIWLIVADGDTWPRERGMRTVCPPELQGAH